MDNGRKRIILVEENLDSMSTGIDILKSLYDVSAAPSAAILFEILEHTLPDLILLDKSMPEVNGYEVLKKLKSNGRFADIPVILIADNTEADDGYAGFNLGAADYIDRPFSPPILLKRVENQLLIISQQKDLIENRSVLKDYTDNMEYRVQMKIEEVVNMQNAVLTTVADLVEFRAGFTGGHTSRTQHYLKILIDELLRRGYYKEELSDWDVNDFLYSAQFHDVGKIAITDQILNKPDKLTDDEFEIMKNHVNVGVDAIEKLVGIADRCASLRHAMSIARTHHERWDGAGYPNGLQGSDIPLEGRLMAIADVYDALISNRPYKKAFSHEEASRIIESGAGTHFDAVLVEAFIGVKDEFAKIAREIHD